MDVSAFDFRSDELPDLMVLLAGLSGHVQVEPRKHQPDEPRWVHQETSAPTFRVAARLEGSALARLPVLAAADLEPILDRDGWIRLRHASHQSEGDPRG